MHFIKKAALRVVVSSIFSLGLAACTTTVNYDAALLPAVPSGITKLNNSAAVAMSPGVEQAVTDVKPSSYTGSATTMRTPVGKIVKEATLQVFGATLSGGVISVSDVAGVSGKDYLIEPVVTAFSYKYDQLSNLGFAITPKVSLTIQVRARDAQGKLVLDKVYTKTDYAKGTYVASLEPAQKVNRALHEVAQLLMLEASKDFVTAVSAQTAAIGAPVS